MYLVILALCLNLSVPEKLKNLIFEVPIIPQNLNIYNKRSTIVQTINFNIRASQFFKDYGSAGKGSG